MTPKVGEVYPLDLGLKGKVRPVVVLSREDPDAPRALALCVPLTTENRGSRYEVPMPRVPWLRLQGVANVQAIGADPFHAGIVDFQAAMLEVERRPAVLGGGQGFERRTFKESHGVET